MIIIFILQLSTVGISLSTGSFCKVFEHMLTTNSINSITTDLKVEVSNDFGDVLNNCLVQGKSGDLDVALDANFKDA